jgi:hypothetical protein
MLAEHAVPLAEAFLAEHPEVADADDAGRDD